MSKYSDAADVIKRQAKQYQALIDAAAALDEIGSLENAAKEAKKLADSAANDAAQAKADLAKAKDAVAKAKLQADDIQAKANDQALAKLQEADQKAQSILDGATLKGNEMIASVTAKAQQQASAIAGQVAQLTSTKVSLEQSVAGLNQAAAAKQAEVDDLEKRLAKVQAQIAKLMGV